MATTPNYGFIMPDPTDFVTNLPADFEIFGDEVDSRIKALNPETTAGDISYRGATANAKVRLGIGTAGQVLRVNSGASAPEWATISAGAFTELASGSLSGATVNLTSISGSYKDLYLVLRNFRVTADAGRIRFRINNNASEIYAITGNLNGTITTFSNEISWVTQLDNTDDDNLGVIYFQDYANTSTFKMANILSIHQDSTTPATIQFTTNRQGIMKTTSAISQINLIALDSSSVANTFAGGTYILYGVN